MTSSTKLWIAAAAGIAVGIGYYVGLESQAGQARDAETAEATRQLALTVPAIAAAIAIALVSLLLWLPQMWRGMLRETNQLSRAVQGKLDDTKTDDRHLGAGI